MNTKWLLHIKYAFLFVCINMCAVMICATRMVWLTSEKGFTIQSCDTNHVKKMDVKSLLIGTYHNKLTLNGQSLVQQEFIIDVPKEGGFFNGVPFNGSVIVRYDNKELQIQVIPFMRKKNRYQLARLYCDLLWGFSVRIERWQRISQNIIDTIQQIKQEPRHKKNRTFTMRVLLDMHKETKNPQSWELFSGVGFLIYDPTNPSNRRFVATPDIVVTRKKNLFCVNRKPFSSLNLCVIPEQGYITFNGQTYQGEFLFTVNNDRVLCINTLDLESYVGSVLHSESWPGWPLEVNKTFAIMTRSYAMAQAHTAQKSKRSYHVKNTNEHQTYKGVHTSASIRRAVQETEGVVIAHERKPILAMFDSCCGGVIPKDIQDGVDFKKAPYLARSYACPYCKDCKIYAWQAEYELETFKRHLYSELHALANLCNVKITKRDKAGLVREIVLRGSKAVKKISGRKLYSLLHDVKSFCFDITHNESKLILSGRGYGHHLGLCQWGAREMVRNGFTHTQILSFYYPQTTLMRMV